MVRTVAFSIRHCLDILAACASMKMNLQKRISGNHLLRLVHFDSRADFQTMGLTANGASDLRSGSQDKKRQDRLRGMESRAHGNAGSTSGCKTWQCQN